MTERGLSTLAVERIVRSRTSRPDSAWPTARAREAPDAQAQVLLRQLASALKVASVVVVNQVCREIGVTSCPKTHR
ncbi:hypothetical protein ACFP1Z_32740 [Streptomyces gamaensis]|uniref:Transposase n=1 Tax=Streptomyces gamaensis TaxID=1763542 RepID=A0ABW0Z7Z8_9ACTN